MNRSLATVLLRQIIAFVCLLGAFAASAAVDKPEFEPALRAAIQKAAVPEAESTRAMKAALWNTNRTAVAVSMSRPAAAMIFVFIRQRDGSFLTVDISAVESGNFGKLGRGRKEYTRFETVPIEWLPRERGYLQVVVRTTAWAGRQRYTVSEPLVIQPDGTPVWR